MALFQIIEFNPDRKRWQFVAHGAAYTRRECQEVFAQKNKNGKIVQSIEIPLD